MECPKTRLVYSTINTLCLGSRIKVLKYNIDLSFRFETYPSSSRTSRDYINHDVLDVFLLESI